MVKNINKKNTQCNLRCKTDKKTRNNILDHPTKCLAEAEKIEYAQTVQLIIDSGGENETKLIYKRSFILVLYPLTFKKTM